MRPIHPTAEAEVRVEKWENPQTDYARRNPWKVLTRYPGELGFTLVGSFETEQAARNWAE